MLAATVQWTPSGAAASSYTVTSSPRGISATVDGSSTSAVVTGLAFATSYTFTVAGTNSSGTGPSSVPSNAITPDAPGGPYHQGAPRVLTNMDVTAGAPVAFNIGADRVHAPGLGTVVLNVTSSNATQASDVQLVLRGEVTQTFSVSAVTVETSLAVIAVPEELNPASIRVTSGQTHVEVDFVGFFTQARTVRDQSGLLQMVPTGVLLDSQIASGASTDIPILGQGNVPGDHVAGVLLNIAAINPSAAGSFELMPSGVADPGIVTLGFAAGQTTANRAIVPLPAGGDITLVDRGASAEARVDVLGWFSDGSDDSAVGALYTALTPARLVDTAAHGGALSAGGSLTIPIWGQGGAPAGSATAPPTSALIQVTAVTPAGSGSIAMGGTTIVDFAAGQTLSGTDIVQLATPGGSVSLSVLSAATNVTVDLLAYFSGDVIMPGTTKVLSASQLAGITNLGSDSITFAPGTPIGSIVLNDVIAAGTSPTSPNGLLRRVLSITSLADGSTQFATRTAGIPEAITSFSLIWSTPPTPGAFGMSQGVHASAIATVAAPRSSNPLPPPPGTSIDPNWPVFGVTPPNTVQFDLSQLDPGLHSGSELDINDLEAQARILLLMSISPSGKFRFQVALSAGARVAIDLQLLAQVDLLDKKQIFDHFFPIGPPIDLQVGLLPIVFQPFIEVNFELKASLAAGFVVSLNFDHYGAISGGYDGSNFFVDPFVQRDYLTPAQEFHWRPSIELQVELDVHFEPNVQFYGFLGLLGADLIPFARFTVDPFAPHWWDLELGLCWQVEFKLNLIFLVKDKVLLPTCIQVADIQAPGPLVPITISPPSATVARSGTQHFVASLPLSKNGVSWSIDEAGGGTLSNATPTDVDYKAPTRAGTYHLRAEANDDPTSAKEAEITVPAVAPSQPTNVVAALTTTTSAIVGWTAPADDGGTALTTYQVTVSPGGAVIQINAPGTTAIFNNLNPGTTYTFAVAATNKANLTSPPSAQSNSITTPPAGPLSVVPTTIDFGTVPLGQSASPQTVLVTAGGNPLAISTVALGGTNPGEFAIQNDSCSHQTIQPGASCSFQVGYTPTIQNSVSAVVSITDDDQNSPQTVTLTGSSPVQATSGVVQVFDIQMIDSQTGYALEAALGSAVLKTTDGGKTWNRLILPAFDQVNVIGVGYTFRFIDAMHGFVGAYRSLQPSGRVTFILSTSDGGQTWQQINPPSRVGVGTFWFSDSLHGWMVTGVAGPPSPPGSLVNSTLAAIYATTDGGLTWSLQTLPDPIIAGTPGCIGQEGNVSVRFADASNGWAGAAVLCFAPNGAITSQGALVWTTNDGGTTWTAHQLPAGILSIYDRIQVIGTSQMRQPGVLTISSTSVEQVLIASDDGGATFSVTPFPVQNGQIVALTFSDSSHGVLLTTDGHVWRTTDGGATWQGNTLPRFVSSAGRITSYGYRAVESPDGTNIWVTGAVFYGFTEAGFIEHSADGGATWTVQLLGSGT